MANPYPAPPASRPAPKWARKRFVIPGVGLAFFIGLGAGLGDDGSTTTKAAAKEARPTVTATVTATATKTLKPKPAPTVTKTVKATKTVKVTVTPRPAPAAGGNDTGADSSDTSSGAAYYGNCTEARAAGAAPVHRGQPGYGRHLDRDGDGVGCDT
ncbi:excalibur calcium-binding domain-containing protein [Streptomyces sp. KN37]|uniref:excalibur calcium-binding domain-containing protein n=1 Tax=Streptomyces sp. KN37 TaxID=3090667 RepID=UPI002A75BC24|nr:excalibur calcium-binding domain-containing protein [Streptomyces sp. KN37]WPO70180.1 excalibur calcium-binding domain-containing protein [Streptomyces sp. KN37]WPO74049.1 excalibur calcium-binding domain-containing protein [Streptomyces sp. KN37]